MRRDLIDFFIVPDTQLGMHLRLENWSRWVEHKVRLGGKQNPMWVNSRSNARQWHAPELREATNELDGAALEVAVAKLPEKHRESLRWYYVRKGGPLHMARKLAVTKDGLMEMVNHARQMLINRKV